MARGRNGGSLFGNKGYILLGTFALVFMVYLWGVPLLIKKPAGTPPRSGSNEEKKQVQRTKAGLPPEPLHEAGTTPSGRGRGSLGGANALNLIDLPIPPEEFKPPRNYNVYDIANPATDIDYGDDYGDDYYDDDAYAFPARAGLPPGLMGRTFPGAGHAYGIYPASRVHQA